MRVISDLKPRFDLMEDGDQDGDKGTDLSIPPGLFERYQLAKDEWEDVQDQIRVAIRARGFGPDSDRGFRVNG